MKQTSVLTFLILITLTALAAVNITGTWSASVILENFTGNAKFTFKQTGEALSGAYTGALGQLTITGSVRGTKAEWSFESGQLGKISFKGVIADGGIIKGSVTYGQLGAGTFIAQKRN